MSIQIGRGCGGRRPIISDTNKNRTVLYSEAIERLCLQAHLEALARLEAHEKWLQSPEGIAWSEREAKKITIEEWTREFDRLWNRGFQPDDIAILKAPDVVLAAAQHNKTGRKCVYVQLDSVVDLYSRPKWLLNPYNWKGALVCFIQGPTEGSIKAVKCLRRGPNSAWVQIVPRP